MIITFQVQVISEDDLDAAHLQLLHAHLSDFSDVVQYYGYTRSQMCVNDKVHEVG